ncbi:helix-turn-helix domain-containing protein [Mucilaginibacter sp. BJC16-A38]|uniref:helix-turn-helix domain-containing protein n=1 Tax=Mucilaginibacter phenanthrenivorans TaxID=1234842 RepID=UPI00215867C5|nr:helix-turn-helix domain-containing protein [Mucilaginibacter phenanthrenivorans]MCR8561319.1 helix-turn-helix domain-containing protein [Mucilaginibacter phenanthrenivorans]
MNNQQLHTFYPEDPLLKKYIDYYYFLKTDDDSFYSSYYSFPNVAYSLNIHKSVSCAIDGHTISVKNDPGNDYLCILQGKYNVPIFVKLQGRLDKITISFKPLGLNHFIKPTLDEVAPKPSQVFTNWQNHPSYNTFMQAFFESGSPVARLRLLEKFLLAQYRPLIEEPLLERSLKMLTDFDHEYTIAEIASSLMLSDRTFNRLFHKHFAISPVAFRKIARFRHSLNNKLFSQQFGSLTEIGYKSNFYDQAYFIKVYREITGENPSRFFDSITKLADDRLIFKFIRE